MFRNIGRKIKTLALVLFWITLVSGVIASMILGIMLCIRGARYYSMYFLAGFGVIIFGSAISFLVSWIGSFFMYGFGQLIDDSEINRQTNQQILRRLESGSASAASNPEPYRSTTNPEGFRPAYRPAAPVAPVSQNAPVRSDGPAAGWYCKKCGMKNESVAKFCLRCGTPNDNA